jgi:hypothetical protein
LDKRFGGLVHQLERFMQDDTVHVEMVEAKNGAYAAKVIFAHEEEKVIHSLYNPQEEAGKFIEQFYNGKTSLFIVIGFGLGYHITGLLQSMSPEQKIVVIEPLPKVFAVTLNYIDISALVGDSRVFLVMEGKQFLAEHKLKHSLSELFRGSHANMKVTLIDYYARCGLYKPYTDAIKTVVKNTFATIPKYRKTFLKDLGLLEKLFSGHELPRNYDDCLALFKKEGNRTKSFSNLEILFLATYYLVSHHAYTEVCKG